MKNRFKKRFLYRHVMPYAGFLFVKIISATYRIKTVNTACEENILKKGHVPLYAAWHQRFFPGFVIFAKRKPISIIISQSKDGDMASRIADLAGWRTVRGSSSRGGQKAMYEITRLALEGYKVGHIVDGPRGPLGVIKPGLLKIAQYSGMPIVPVAPSAEKKWVFNSWDRYQIPKPFTRLIFNFGDEIYVPENLNESDFEEKRILVECSLKQLIDETDRLWSEPEKIRHLFGR